MSNYTSNPFMTQSVHLPSLCTTLTLLPTEFYSKFKSAVAEEINLERGDDLSHVLSLFATSSRQIL